MKEVEVKILEINVSEVRQKLLELGAEEIPEVLIVEEIFDWPDRLIKQRGEVLRLRQIGDKIELVYKLNPGETAGFKILEELEVEVSDFTATRQVLSALGLRAFQHREKRRTTFKLGGIKYEIDKYPTIPAYLEIEGSEEKLVSAAVEKLGFSISQTQAIFAGRVLKNYGQDPDYQKF